MSAPNRLHIDTDEAGPGLDVYEHLIDTDTDTDEDDPVRRNGASRPRGRGPAVRDVDEAAPREVERAVLRACLVSAEAAQLVLGQLHREDFGDPVHEMLFGAMNEAATEGAADANLVAATVRACCSGVLRDEGLSRLEELHVGNVGNVGNVVLDVVPRYVEEIRTASRRRQERDVREQLQRASDSVAQDLAIRKLAELHEVRQDEPVDEGPEALTLEDWLAKRDAGELPVPAELFADYDVRERFIVGIGGAPGVGKSQFCIGVSVTAAAGVGAVIDPNGVALMGYVGARPIPVLYVCSEGSAALMLERFEQRLALHNLDLDAVQGRLRPVFPEGDHRDLQGTEGQAWLFRQVERHRPALVVLDNLTDLFPRLDHCDRREVRQYAVQPVLYALRDRFSVTQLVALHANQQGDGRGGLRPSHERFFGSNSGWLGAMDGAILLDEARRDRPNEPYRILLEHAKARFAARHSTALLEPPDAAGNFRVLKVDVHERTAADGTRPGPDAKVTLAALREALAPAGTWVLRAAVAERIGVTETALRRRLPDLRDLLGEELEEGTTEDRYARAQLRLVGGVA